MISVFIANYNHGEFLAQSIESVLNQTYKDLELIIVDDGSTDHSLDIVCHYRELDARIKTHIFLENKGALSAVDQAMSMCTGEYIFGRAADDYLTDMDFFTQVIDAFERYPQAAGVYGRCAVIMDGQEAHDMGRPHSCAYLEPDICKELFAKDDLFIPGASSIWRRELVDAMGGFDHALCAQSDWYLNHVLALKHGVVALPSIVAHVRDMPGSLHTQPALHDMAVEKMRQHVSF